MGIPGSIGEKSRINLGKSYTT